MYLQVNNCVKNISEGLRNVYRDTYHEFHTILDNISLERTIELNLANLFRSAIPQRKDAESISNLTKAIEKLDLT